MSTRVKVYGLLLGLMLGGGGLYYASKSPAVAEALGKTPKKDEKKAKKGGDEIVPVELADARKGPISAYLTSTANLKALRDVEVDAEGVMALAKLPAIAKGYGETHAAGTASFERAIAAYREQGPSALQALARSGRTAPACAPAAATVVQPLVFHRR